ncbi:hypothetical protein K474DRAFT_1699702 [Panus rudis PR-1116 ss-1]|nr:hypothetical protein K474DRAFT_1699702 [Panus rudis PR-1116 ss-1]
MRATIYKRVGNGPAHLHFSPSQRQPHKMLEDFSLEYYYTQAAFVFIGWCIIKHLFASWCNAGDVCEEKRYEPLLQDQLQDLEDMEAHVRRTSLALNRLLSSTSPQVTAPFSNRPMLDKLPYELWLTIFRHIKDDSEDRTRDILNVSAVCSVWRAIAVHSTDLWDTIDIGIDSPPSWCLCMLFATRAVWRPLDVTIRRYRGYAELDMPGLEEAFVADELVTLMGQYSSRLRRVHIEVYYADTLIYLFPLWPDMAPAIQDLTVISHHPTQSLFLNLDDWQFLSSTPILHDLPNIRNVKLTASVCLNDNIFRPFATIRSLTLTNFDYSTAESYPPIAFARKLSELQFLEHLVIDGSRTSDMPHDYSNDDAKGQSHPFNKLQSVTFINLDKRFYRKFINHIVAPQLKVLDLERVHLCDCVVRLFRNMSQPGRFPSLDTIRLAKVSGGLFERIVHYLDYCKHLEIQACCSIEDADLVPLFCSEDEGVAVGCPNLESLVLHSIDLITMSNLRGLIQSRINAPGRRNISRVRKLHVYADARLSIRMREWFAASVNDFRWDLKDSRSWRPLTSD